jgi:RNA polymerase sigma factor (sigma-70 family)
MPDSPSDDLRTRPSMFGPLNSPDEPSRQLAWERFRERYAPVIAGFARNLGASRQDIDDIIQDVFLRFFVASEKFVYDPAKGRFRGYLKVATLNVIRTRMGGRAKLNTVPLSDIGDNDVPLESNWDEHWQRQLLKHAIELVREEYASHSKSFDAFERYVILAMPPEDVARELGTSVDNVYQAKHRVTAAIREKVKQLKQAEQ